MKKIETNPNLPLPLCLVKNELLRNVEFLAKTIQDVFATSALPNQDRTEVHHQYLLMFHWMFHLPQGYHRPSWKQEMHVTVKEDKKKRKTFIVGVLKMYTLHGVYLFVSRIYVKSFKFPFHRRTYYGKRRGWVETR